MTKPKILALLPDPLWAYDRKGYSRQERHDYYNPNGEFEVSLVEFGQDDIKPYKFAGFKVYPSNSDLKNIKRIMGEVQPNLVRAYNGANDARLAGEIGRVYGIPSITSVHNLYPSKDITKIDKVICVSDAVKQKCLEKGALKDKLVVINEGVNLDLFKDCRDNSITYELGVKYPGDYRIISVGRLTWQKNLERLVEASNIANNQLGYLTHLHIGNLGQMKDELTKQINDSQHIHLLSNVTQEELPYFYSWADAFTMASVSEGFGLVYIEALACRTPVVTSNLPPMTEYVEDNYNGLLVDPNSSKDIAEKIYKILTNKSLHEKLRLNARESVKKFDIRKLKRQEAQLYYEMLR